MICKDTICDYSFYKNGINKVEGECKYDIYIEYEHIKHLNINIQYIMYLYIIV